MIAKEAQGFIYLVSSMGVTGVRNDIKTNIKEIVEAIRKVTDTPIAVGFGINKREQVQEYFSVADGAIVGSAIIKIIAQYGEDAGEYIYNYIRELIAE